MVIVSIGRHTRLGDVLDFAVAGVPIESVDAEDFSRGNWTNRNLLFAISADSSGENAQLRALTARMNEGASPLNGCRCAAIADGALGGQVHLDALFLLLAANFAGAELIARPLLESGKDLRNFASGKESSFERYRILTRALVERLREPQITATEHLRVRFLTTLEGGASHDWRGVIDRIVTTAGGEVLDIGEIDSTILLCENTDGLPDERTLSLLGGTGRLRLLLASPTTGSDLYTAALMERACLRGNYALPPKAIVVFEGISAVEALASKWEMERVKGIFVK